MPGLIYTVITHYRLKAHAPLCSPFCPFPYSPGSWSSHLLQGMVTQHSSLLLLSLLITAKIKRATTYPIPCCMPGARQSALHVLTCLVLTMTLWRGYNCNPIYSWSARLRVRKDQRGRCKGKLAPEPELDVPHAPDPWLIRCLELGAPFQVRFRTSLPGVPRTATCNNSIIFNI